MALEDFSSPKPEKWVTVGGRDKNGNKNQETLEGYYLGSTEAPSQFDSTKMKVTHMFKTADGTVGVNGSANLNMKIKESEGNLQRRGKTTMGAFGVITFTGTVPSGKGNPTKIYTVQFDPENTIEVAALPVSQVYEDDDTEDTSDADDAAQSAALAAAEKKAKFEALLKNGKGKVTR